ncbi:anthranilate synthase component I family protein [Pseudomonas stutzeri]|uniref:anthranilate synthase component I family protein n=1 Tax=Stutzerimonas stutzeri TaxID=316 RepID=UPI001E5B394C|nr:anthranilate synthase component I family protein [Stutzerimonas stutzeri]MCC8345407.1 anthranilate synthase component I family protein [Stutzerimonas stutzeri]
MLKKISLPSKPKYLKLTEDIDFFELFKKIENEYKTCFLFESLADDDYHSRYHIIGFDPEKIYFSNSINELCIQNMEDGHVEKHECDNAYYLLRELIPQKVISRTYSGGLVGYLGYDSINLFEPSLDVKSSQDFEIFKFGLYLDGLVYDKLTGEIFYFYYTKSRYAELSKFLKDSPQVKSDSPLVVERLDSSMSKSEHRDAVLKVKEYIRSGLIFQCEVGFRKNYKITGNHLDIYTKLRVENPSPHMYYMRFEDQKIIGASPELLFRLRNKEMETFPLAGTAKRGINKEDDRRLARQLLSDPKEIAEHNMLVDLHRNDLGRVAKFGTVKVRKLMDIKRFSHVQHISSEIVGIIDDDNDMFTALAANFPAGTLSGAPKIEAIKVIDELEKVGRGPYGGAIGEFCFNGDCAFAIPIRSIFIKGNDAYVQTCGGNVFDSDPEDEYIEIERKFAAMKKVLESF